MPGPRFSTPNPAKASRKQLLAFIMRCMYDQMRLDKQCEEYKARVETSERIVVKL